MDQARNSPIHASYFYINDFCSRPRRAHPDTVLTVQACDFDDRLRHREDIRKLIKSATYMYRGTSIIRNTPPVGPYGMTMRRLLGGGAVSYDRGTPVVAAVERNGTTRQSRPDYGLIVQAKVLETF